VRWLTEHGTTHILADQEKFIASTLLGVLPALGALGYFSIPINSSTLLTHTTKELFDGIPPTEFTEESTLWRGEF
jgi:hypothetical protein